MLWVKRMASILLAVTLCICCVGCDDNDTDKLKECVVAAEIQHYTDIYTIYKSTVENVAYIYKNGKCVETKRSVKANREIKLLELDSSKIYQELDRSSPFAENTYEASILQSTEHLNWLKINGHNIVFMAKTEDYIELYTTHPDYSLYNRIIIMPGYIVIYGTEDLNFDINNYV